MSSTATDRIAATVLGRRLWIQATIAAAAVVSTADGVLLQQKKSFFTGGFLVATHANSVPESLGFLAGSLILDASTLGILTAVVLWLTSRARLTRPARFCLAVTGAIAPTLIWNVINYSLLTYLGDAFDFGLMFDLSGRKLQEIFAVAYSHLLNLGALTVGVTAAAAVGIWAVNRYGDPHTRSATRISWLLVAAAGGLFLLGLLTFTTASRASELLEDGFRRKASGQVFLRLTSALTDFDRDGFGIGGRLTDPAPWNAAVHPYALDVPGNQIDEDAIGGDLPAAGPYYTEVAATTEKWRQRPSVILFVLESFRADALGQVVKGQPVTPVITALAEQGVSSELAFSHNGYTTQSRFHLLTGSLAGLLGESSLVDDFKANGYQTAYFSAQDESFGGPSLGIGFDRVETAYDARQDRERRYTTFTTAGSLAVSHVTLQRRIEDFLRTRDPARPLFLYVNFYDTHFPYHHTDMAPILSGMPITQGQIKPSRRDRVREMYYNAAANVDRALGSTLETVTRTLGTAPAVIVTADHGESLFDEGFLGHGYALNDMQTRIPLVVRGLPLEIVEPFGQVDLRNAIGDALSKEPEAGVTPRLIRSAGKYVFQYLGNLNRPRQIAFTGPAGRLIYDFRETRISWPDGTSSDPHSLSETPAVQFLGLVHFWERMMVARAAGGARHIE